MTSGVMALLGLASMAIGQAAPAAPAVQKVEFNPAIVAAKPADADKKPADAKADAKEAAPAAAAPAGPLIVTVQGERIAAAPQSIADGKLTVATEPPRTLALDEIDRIELAGAPGLSLVWLGQDNHDVVQVGSAQGGNGIQDMHLRLTGLPAKRRITQVVAVCKYASLLQKLVSQQLRVWRLDTAQTPHWRLAVERTDAAASAAADLYLEPSSVDAFGQEFALTVTYDDGSTAKIATKATTHTSDQLKVGAAPAPVAADPAAEPAPAVVYLEGRDVLRGQVISMGDESLTLTTTWQTELKIPTIQVLGVMLGTVSTPQAREQFDKQLAQPGSEDVALVLGNDQNIAQISGSAQGLADGKLQFTYEGESRSIGQAKLVGLVFATHPAVRATGMPTQVFYLKSADVISGTWAAAGDKAFELETPWKARVQVPRDQVWKIAFRNGKMIYLSDLEPAAVEEVPYFGHRMPYRRDQSLLGAALKMKDKDYEKGLAVHSRSLLTYALDGQFETFKTVVGFDDSAGGRGRVLCRVAADGKELLVQPDLRASGDPLAIDLNVGQAKQLTLEIDFGEAEDTGDRVIWADARVFRK